MKVILIWLIAYVLGSIPTGYWLGKIIKNVDIRKEGSGNIGATNAMRILGWKIGAWVYPLDFLKGLIPVIIAKNYYDQEWIIIITGIFAVAGHMYSLFIGFKGGKGVLTSAGVLTGMVPFSVLFAFIVFFLVFFKWRFISLSSIIASIFLPLFLTIEFFGKFLDKPGVLVLILAYAIGTFIVVKHRTNIERLRKGTEPHFTIKH